MPLAAGHQSSSVGPAVSVQHWGAASEHPSVIPPVLRCPMPAGESKHFTLSFSLGCALALVGFAMYSSAQLTKLRAALKPEAITIAASGGGGVKTVPVLQTTAKGERLPLRPLPR